MTKEFANVNIDEENLHGENESTVLVLDSQDYLNVIGGKEIIQLKINCIPKGLVPLEKIFDNNDVARNPKVTRNDNEVEDCNIGTRQEPKIVKVSKSLTPQSKKNILV